MADPTSSVLELKATLDSYIEAANDGHPLPERKVRELLGELDSLELTVDILRATKVDRTLDELKHVLGADQVALGVQRKELKHKYRELKREYKRVHGGWSSTRSDSTYVNVPAVPDSLDDAPFVAPVPVLKIKLGAQPSASHQSPSGPAVIEQPRREGIDGRTVNGQWYGWQELIPIRPWTEQDNAVPLPYVQPVMMNGDKYHTARPYVLL
eukprot:TRINITY_DN4585_c0_g1_i2.p1 TRINITY_DN4585_c0_g1~~TRINITY_DN4585_c0_g1_i2.p1  ORF type:complete len:211 (+),score=33.23 TRINITY_DN4585_c0_g1_i2:84-716(+)